MIKRYMLHIIMLYIDELVVLYIIFVLRKNFPISAKLVILSSCINNKSINRFIANNNNIEHL